MRIGISSACFYPLESEEALRKIGEMGGRVCEFFINSFDELSGSVLSELISIKNYYGIEIKSVHPMTSGYEAYMFFGAYPRRTDYCMELYKKYNEFANKMGAGIINFHGDRYSQERCDINEYCEIYSRLYNNARKEGIIFSQENVSKCKSRDISFIKNMRSVLGDDNVSFTLDLKQSYRSGVEPLDMARAMGEQLVHIHFNDYDETCDCLLPFYGKYDIINVFDYLYNNNFDIDMIIEVYRSSYNEYSDIKNSYDISRQKLTEYLELKTKKTL